MNNTEKISFWKINSHFFSYDRLNKIIAHLIV